MSDLTYVPAQPLGAVQPGDIAQILDRNGSVISEVVIDKVTTRSVTTECGRRWTLQYGEFISHFQGSRPISFPFPCIRKKVADHALV
ncbi:hypothetical protein V8Z80_08225 [Orrella sp. JC864]|uniref:hypothetical protein n=1 Tax=Orrella sp. JC864 TaxID=3120298 RepID=UPI0030093A60